MNRREWLRKKRKAKRAAWFRRARNRILWLIEHKHSVRDVKGHGAFRKRSHLR